MKKRIWIALILAAALVFCACSNKAETSAPAAEPTAAVTLSEPVAKAEGNPKPLDAKLGATTDEIVNKMKAGTVEPNARITVTEDTAGGSLVSEGSVLANLSPNAKVSNVLRVGAPNYGYIDAPTSWYYFVEDDTYYCVNSAMDAQIGMIYLSLGANNYTHTEILNAFNNEMWNQIFRSDSTFDDPSVTYGTFDGYDASVAYSINSSDYLVFYLCFIDGAENLHVICTEGASTPALEMLEYVMDTYSLRG